jgi:cytochrome c2
MRHVVALVALALGGCASGSGDRFAEAKGLIEARCASCHMVPGVRVAVGKVGPPLTGIGKRQVIAGYFPNSRDNLVRWISHPQSMLPGNAMPDTGLTQAQAGSVADYLYTLDK